MPACACSACHSQSDVHSFNLRFSKWNRRKNIDFHCKARKGTLEYGWKWSLLFQFFFIILVSMPSPLNPFLCQVSLQSIAMAQRGSPKFRWQCYRIIVINPTAHCTYEQFFISKRSLLKLLLMHQWNQLFLLFINENKIAITQFNNALFAQID